MRKNFKVLDGIAVDLKGYELLKLAEKSGIRSITPDAPVKPSGFDPVELWPLAVGAPGLWGTTDPATGGFTPGPQVPAIAVIDSGVEAGRLADFGARLVASVNLSSLGPNATGDDNGHGTLVAGFAAGEAQSYPGAAPNANIVSLRVVDGNGMALTSDVIAAADWVFAHGAQYGVRVANFSLHTGHPNYGLIDPLNLAVRRLWLTGTVVVAAAGNHGPQRMLYAPASDPFVITVGALDLNQTAGVADDFNPRWSSYGYTAECRSSWHRRRAPRKIPRRAEPRRDKALTDQLSKELVTGKRDHYRFEQRYVRKDRTVWWGSLTVSLIRDADGRPDLMIAMLKDVTERKRADDVRRQVEAERERLLVQERQQIERLRELDRLKDEFIATVSHELRTPLTSIIGYLELVLEGEAGELEPEQRSFLEVAERNAGSLLELVRDLLFVGQVNAGRVDLEIEPVSVSKLAADCVESARPQAEEKGIELVFEGGDVPELPGDDRRLVQLADNLISNALKFTDEGGKVSIRTSVTCDGRATIEVEDSGMGISEADQLHLFKRFFRASVAAERAILGTGLGLSIAKTIAEAHGGRISVESTEGVGTKFRVELPLRDPARLRLPVAAAA